jgi:hypothetical protein
MTNLAVFLNEEHTPKNILEYTFLYFEPFLAEIVFRVKNLKNGTSKRWNFFLEIGNIEFTKVENFMVIIKKKFIFVTKCTEKS